MHVNNYQVPPCIWYFKEYQMPNLSSTPCRANQNEGHFVILLHKLTFILLYHFSLKTDTYIFIWNETRMCVHTWRYSLYFISNCLKDKIFVSPFFSVLPAQLYSSCNFLIMSYGDVDGNLTLDLQKKRNNITNIKYMFIF